MDGRSSRADLAMAPTGRPRRILVTGATGYIGGRLAPRLAARGHHVRCVARDPGRLAGRDWPPGVEIVGGDLADATCLPALLDGIDVAYYLVHSMSEGEEFRERDRAMASAFGRAAADAGVERIVYLGGLGRPEEVRSRHLVSRQEVGRALAVAGVPVVEFRAAVIVGSGSASFEMIRHLVERLPVMITPRWIDTRCQPIAVRDVLDYLQAALDGDVAGIYEIGGRDVLSYREMMLQYAKVRGLRRVIVALPVPRPELSSRFVGLVTPVPYRIVHPLVQSLQHEVVVRNERAADEFEVRPMGYAEAVGRAMARLATDDVETTWASSLASLSRDEPEGRVLLTHEGMLLERHRRRVEASPEQVFEQICALGGDAGWPSGNALWQLRGLMDRACGGVGMRRGRRHPRELLAGDPLDFWRVETIEPPHVLRLRAEMKLPGRAWLQFEVQPDDRGARVEQTALYEPRGIPGYAYWYAVRPFHRFIFPGMLRAIADRSVARGR